MLNMMSEEKIGPTNLALTHYEKVVEAVGGYGEFIENPDDLEGALERAFASGKAACINVVLDKQGIVKTGASTPYIV
jgi:acetolactate synthase-1/2/3 large subunit